VGVATYITGGNEERTDRRETNRKFIKGLRIRTFSLFASVAPLDHEFSQRKQMARALASPCVAVHLV